LTAAALFGTRASKSSLLNRGGQPRQARDLTARDRNHPELAVQHERFGQLRRAVALRIGAVDIAQVGKGETEMLDRAERFAGQVLVGDTDDRPLVVAGEQVLRPLEQTSLGVAGGAPGGPEVDDDDTATPVRQRGRSAKDAVEHGQGRRRVRRRRVVSGLDRRVERAARALLR
jgi:hypothetical protein